MFIAATSELLGSDPQAGAGWFPGPQKSTPQSSPHPAGPAGQLPAGPRQNTMSSSAPESRFHWIPGARSSILSSYDLARPWLSPGEFTVPGACLSLGPG